MKQIKKLTRRDILKLLGIAALDVGMLAVGISG
jgi:hypothetical protein